MREEKRIGVFDSGFGGLNILRGIIKKLPEYDYLYLGDTARAPYGPRSQDKIYEFSKQAVNFLFENDCELIILACNTASSGALRRIQQEYLPKHHPEKRVLGVLIPAAEEAAKRTKNKKVGVMATEATVHSGAFVREFANIDPHIEILQIPCPLLVSLIEAGKQHSPKMKQALERYLSSFENAGIDTLILGCTHYGIIENEIKKLINHDLSIISEERVIPQKLKNYLKRHQKLERMLGKNGQVLFTTTGETKGFMKLGSQFFGKKLDAETISFK